MLLKQGIKFRKSFFAPQYLKKIKCGNLEAKYSSGCRRVLLPHIPLVCIFAVKYWRTALVFPLLPGDFLNSCSFLLCNCILVLYLWRLSVNNTQRSQKFVPLESPHVAPIRPSNVPTPHTPRYVSSHTSRSRLGAGPVLQCAFGGCNMC